jgi:ABC-type multidrug transport system permease subunit
MIGNKALTSKGWRVVAHSVIAAVGIGLLYLLSRMIIGDIRQENMVSWWILGLPMVWALYLVALARMLAKAELTD